MIIIINNIPYWFCQNSHGKKCKTMEIVSKNARTFSIAENITQYIPWILSDGCPSYLPSFLLFFILSHLLRFLYSSSNTILLFVIVVHLFESGVHVAEAGFEPHEAEDDFEFLIILFPSGITVMCQFHTYFIYCLLLHGQFVQRYPVGMRNKLTQLPHLNLTT